MKQKEKMTKEEVKAKNYNYSFATVACFIGGWLFNRNGIAGGLEGVFMLGVLIIGGKVLNSL